MSATRKRGLAEPMLPCPFCGSAEVLGVSCHRADGEADSFQCANCGASTDAYRDEREARKWWNTRSNA